MAKTKDDISPELAFSNYFHNVEGLRMDNPQEHREKDNVLYRWTGTHWEAVLLDAMERDAINWFASHMPNKCNVRCASSSVATVIKRAESLPDAARTVIPTVNGYLHIRGDEITLSPSDAALGITYCLACRYDPEAIALKFGTFIAEALPDAEVRAYLQEYAGIRCYRIVVTSWLVGLGHPLVQGYRTDPINGEARPAIADIGVGVDIRFI